MVLIRRHTPEKDSDVSNRGLVSASKDVKDRLLNTLSDLNVCSQKGLVETFDSSIGAATVHMPYGGKYQMSEIQTMIASLPLLSGNTETVSMMSYGFDPYLSSWSPYHGAVYAVTESIAKIVAAGGDYKTIRFTFQEYFRRMTEDPKRWSQPTAALLGAFEAQLSYGLPSIGGKDSMSGTFNDIDVPPTLVSFAVNTANVNNVISPELKNVGNKLVAFKLPKDKYSLPDYKKVMDLYDKLHTLIKDKAIVSAFVADCHGLAVAVSKMAFGNKLGVKYALSADELFKDDYCTIIAEVSDISKINVDYTLVGEVTADALFTIDNVAISLDDALAAFNKTLEPIFPTIAEKGTEAVESPIYKTDSIYVCKNKIAKPTVFIPVFPGTNCEYDSSRAFKRAGADTIVTVFKNQSAQDIKDSIEEFKKSIAQSQIVFFPGGFSAGDEPEGSAKFFATAFRNEVLKEEIDKLLSQRDGLMIGICNGFQALIKLGLVPGGKIVDQDPESATLTFNTIGRHISKMVYTKLVSNKSPWTLKAEAGEVYVNPASHGEGRFVAPEATIKKLFENGQVLTQYCDINGNVSMDENWNVNGSFCAIEGITSPDGRVLGKMAHSERRDIYTAANIYGKQDMMLFESGVEYFK